MAPNARGVWTPRLTMGKFLSHPYKPKIHTSPYKKPPPPKKRMTIEEAMTPEGAAELASMAQAWITEADRLERDTPIPTFEQTVGDILFQKRINIRRLMEEWADVGTVQKGEFRLKIRATLMPDATSADIDALFDQYNGDGGGNIDSEELKAAFTRIKENASEWRRTVMIPRERAAKLRERAAAAKEASVAVGTAEQLERELEELDAALSGNIEVQLGMIMAHRKINVGDIVGAWAVSRRNELTRQEFRDNVRLLLPSPPVRTSSGGPQHYVHSKAEIDALFDRIDADKGGTIDIREAKHALKDLQQRSAQAIRDREAKASHAARTRRRASQKTQAAIRPEAGRSDGGDSDGFASPGGDGSPYFAMSLYGSDDDVDGGSPSRFAGLFSGFLSEEQKDKKEQEEKRKRAAALRAKQALLRMQSRELGTGWHTWHTW